MKKWYDEEYEWEIEVKDFLRGDKTEGYCRSGDLENIGGDSKYTKDVVCPDGCVLFRMTAKKLGNKNFYKGKFWG